MDERERSASMRRAMSALQWVAGLCDGAVSADGMGFSGTDAALGHALAGKAVWSHREAQAALHLVSKYKNQVVRAGLSVEGLDELREALRREGPAQAPRLQRSDVVTGNVRVDEAKQQIVLSTQYHPQLVKETRDLVGAAWNPQAKLWTCKLCAENAMAVEGMAERWGLTLTRHSGWALLAPLRDISADGSWLRIKGVNAASVLRSLPQLEGRPEVDQSHFRAVRSSVEAVLEIPLRTWVIRSARLWFDSLPEDQESRLGWARNQVIAMLDSAYPTAASDERLNYSLSAAPSLPAASQAGLRQVLPPALSEALLPHQWVAVKALAAQDQCILADEQGLGKTVEILAALEANRAYPAVVVVPATAIMSWRDEIALWLPHRQVSLCGAGVGKRDQGAPLATAEIKVVNYESFEAFEDDLSTVQPKALVLDEAHYLKGHDSARTKAVKLFCAKLRVARIILATGTPILNRPSELLTLLTLLPDLLIELGGFAWFAARYCEATRHHGWSADYWTFSGASNLGELANRLRETGRFIRRVKASVLPKLSPKARTTLDVEITNRAEYERARDDFAGWLRSKNHGASGRRRLVESDSEESRLRTAAQWMGWSAEAAQSLGLDAGARAEALRRLTALRQLAGIGKIDAATRWILNVVKDEKLVVFAYHLDVQNALSDALQAAGIQPLLMITGDMKVKARHEAIAQFQCDPAARVIICSLSAAKTAITLTAARRALLVEADWSPAGMEQAEDRIHRIGQPGQVEITYMRGEATLDDRMFSVLDSKRLVISEVSGDGAPFGYKADGTPRRRPAGPGRRPLDPAVREERRKARKSKWQIENRAKHREYVRSRRLAKRVAAAQRAVQEFEDMKRRGLQGTRYELDDHRYSQRQFEEDLKAAATRAEAATKFLSSVKGADD